MLIADKQTKEKVVEYKLKNCRLTYIRMAHKLVTIILNTYVPTKEGMEEEE